MLPQVSNELFNTDDSSLTSFYRFAQNLIVVREDFIL